MKNLIEKLQLKQNEKLEQFQKEVSELLKPIENHVFLGVTFIHEEQQDDISCRFDLIIIGSSDDNQYLNVSDFYTKIHFFNISFCTTKKDTNQKESKVLGIKGLDMKYVAKSYDNTDILDLINQENICYSSLISKYSNINQLVSNIIFDFSSINDEQSWYKLGMSKTDFARSDFKRDVIFHKSVMNTMMKMIDNKIQQKIESYEKLKDFDFLVKKVQNEYLKNNLIDKNIETKRFKL